MPTLNNIVKFIDFFRVLTQFQVNKLIINEIFIF